MTGYYIILQNNLPERRKSATVTFNAREQRLVLIPEVTLRELEMDIRPLAPGKATVPNETPYESFRAHKDS